MIRIGGDSVRHRAVVFFLGSMSIVQGGWLDFHHRIPFGSVLSVVGIACVVGVIQFAGFQRGEPRKHEYDAARSCGSSWEEA